MKSKMTIMLLPALLFILSAVPSVMAVTLTVGNGSGITGDTIQIPIAVDNPVGIAGAAFTIEYDTDNLILSEIQSDFFAAFSNQWAALSPPPNPFPPTSVTVDSVTYTQPLLNNLVPGSGMLISAARCKAETIPANTTLFTLSFMLKTGAPASTYSIHVISTRIHNSEAGYTAQGEAIPILTGSDPAKSITDPDAFPTLLDPSAQPAVGLVLPGSVTFKVDTDGDGVADDQDPFPNDPRYWHDTDGDGMPDEWETSYGLNPLVNDAGGDADKDGVKNLLEYIRGTSPTDPGSKPSLGMPWLPLLLSN